MLLKVRSAAAVDRKIREASADLADECAGAGVGREEAFPRALAGALRSIATARAAGLGIEAHRSHGSGNSHILSRRDRYADSPFQLRRQDHVILPGSRFSDHRTIRRALAPIGQASPLRKFDA